MLVVLRYCCSAIGWRLGLQAVTAVVFLTFILGTFYRSASLYHPQRRAILHLKNQKRKIKDKNKIDDKLPFFDFSTLRSKTVRILLVSTGISSFGINTPIFYLVSEILTICQLVWRLHVGVWNGCGYCENWNNLQGAVSRSDCIMDWYIVQDAVSSSDCTLQQ